VEEFSEIEAVWKGETKRSVSSGRFIALVLLFLMAEGLTLTIVGFISVGINKQFDTQMSGQGLDPSLMREQILAKKKDALSWVMNAEDATIEAMASLPIVLLIVHSLTSRFIPLLIALMGFDQTAGEIGPKSIRFLLLRVRRNSIVLGKFLAQISMMVVLLVPCVVGMILVTKLLNPDFAWAAAFTWGFKLLVALILVGTTYAALTALFSSLVKTGSLALFLNVMGILGFWFLGLLGEYFRIPGHPAVGLDAVRPESILGIVRYLVPSTYQDNLLAPVSLDYAIGIFAHLGFTLLFLGLALVGMKKRDL
jgi:ABC-type transport system involved in multi-copper enzyme maturation permease subunit